MARDNGQGMFTMDFINQIAVMNDLAAAKAQVQAHIDAAVATDANKRSATMMVYNSRTLKNLVLGMGNFALSHMGMKTFR